MINHICLKIIKIIAYQTCLPISFINNPYYENLAKAGTMSVSLLQGKWRKENRKKNS